MADNNESCDILWINETLQGNARTFNNLILKYQDPVYTFVVRSIRNETDAEDITQNVFISAFSNLKKFRKECSFKTWLYRIATNRVKNYWRDKKNRFVVSESELKPSDENEDMSHEIAAATKKHESDKLKRLAANLLASLPLDQRLVFILYYDTGCSCEQIAEIFKTSVSNIKIQLFRGRQSLFDNFNHLL
jgi:RNA polymerase sigma-70 factor, ECF subfamily